ncbi:MAG TPA: PP2C family protein-serine/threonine phosphatase [Candidatus Krumholzibacteria bacterium]|nr:PP2C family protein-serine/threonine phosphatase [Candidatus Krumholzibacteria bacterium]
MASPNQKADFWKGLSLRARVQLSIGIAATFATIGIFQDFWAPGAPPWYIVALHCLVAGSISLSWAYTFMWSKKFVPMIVVTTLASIVLGTWSSYQFPNSGVTSISAWQTRGAVEAFFCMVLIAIGYIFFVRFIDTEGTEQLRLRTEVNLAREIHEVLVPSVHAIHGTVEIYGRSIASSEVGGDLMDVFEGDHGVVVTVADVSGHGVGAGTMMAMMKSATRVKLMNGAKLDALVHDLNRIMFQLKGDGMFATISALRFHPDGAVETAVAGHLPLLRVRGNGGEVDVLPNEHVPLGILEDASFWSRELRGEPGDVFILITDGLTEVENARGDELGWEPIRDLAVSMRGQPLPDIHDAVMHRVTTHGPQADDQTLVLIRIL